MRNTEAKKRKNSVNFGTFGRTSTGRTNSLGSDHFMARHSLPSRTPLTARGPNLRTADRSNRRQGSVSSFRSGNNKIPNQSEGLNVLGISEETLAQFKENIVYEAQTGNSLDESLAMLINKLNIKMPIKLIDDKK